MLLSGRSLAQQCRWNCCPRYPLNFSYLSARHGDTVFLNLDFVQNFTRHFVLGIRKKFILVCQNSDREFNAQRLAQLRPYALHIYSINCVIQDPMVTAVPIGFGDWSLDFLPAHPKDPVERTIEIYSAFTTTTNPAARKPCADAMKKDPRAVIELTPYRHAFYEQLRRSKYVVCPQGEGHDTHRIYESLYFGAIPVVLSPNPLDAMYEGWPLKRVTSWEQMEFNYEEDTLRLQEWRTRNPTWYEMQLPL